MTSPTFSHFEKPLFDFLKDLKQNNNKAWFQENKSRYKEAIVHPLQDFISAINTPLAKVSKHYVADPRVNGGSIFRIYRDVRFSKDKTPYKEHAACHFRHEAGKDAHAPGFYMHLETDKVFFGGGVWLPPPDVLYKIRDRIRSKPKEWEAVINNKTLIDVFGSIKGDSLTRPPKGFDKDTPHLEDIKRKSFFAIREEPVKLARSAAFFDEVLRTYKAATPLMRFICKAIDVPF